MFSHISFEARPRRGLDTNLPDEYDGGVLVSLVKPFIPVDIRQITPTVSGPMVAQRRGSALSQAAYRPGETFSDTSLGVKIEVLDSQPVDPVGSFRVKITREELPAPDVGVVDAWLDNPVNGFNTFLFPPGGAFGDPAFSGDNVASRLITCFERKRVCVVPGPFGCIQEATIEVPVLPPEVDTPAHRVFLRVMNHGNLVAEDVTGTLYLLGPAIPAGLDLSDPSALLPLSFDSIDVNFGDIDPDDTVVRQVSVDPPDGPFVVALVLDQVENEPFQLLLNNFHFEPFAVYIVAFGSPYELVGNPLEIRNMDKNGHVVALRHSPLPDGWTGGIKNNFAALDPGESAEFTFFAQAPDPTVDPTWKPGQIQEIILSGWMDYDDSFIRLVDFPVQVVLSSPTKLTLQCKGDVLAGLLTSRPLEGRDLPVENALINIVVTGSDGSEQNLEAFTDSSGFFTVGASIDLALQYAAIAQYSADMPHKGSQSNVTSCGAFKDIVITSLRVSPDNVVPGEEISVSWNVKNDGTDTITGSYKEDVYLSKDATLDVSDIKLGTSDEHTTDLSSGSVLAGSISAKIPKDTTEGTLIILVQGDAGDNIPESNEPNNVSVTKIRVEGDSTEPTPKLTVTSKETPTPRPMPTDTPKSTPRPTAIPSETPSFTPSPTSTPPSKSFTFACDKEVDILRNGIERLILNLGEKTSCQATLTRLRPNTVVEISTRLSSRLMPAVKVEPRRTAVNENGEASFTLTAVKEGINWIAWAVRNDKDEFSFNRNAYANGSAWGMYVEVKDNN